MPGVRQLVQRPRRISHRFALAMVERIDRYKYDMLALSAATAIGLSLTALFLILFESDGAELTKSLADIGGYVAIAGLVLGLPALVYAMTTDSKVERIQDQIGASKESVDDTRQAIAARLARFLTSLPPEHSVQVFVPERLRDHIVPIYDPEYRGPEQGWSIDPATPQAISGSAWVGRSYLWATDEELKQVNLRLNAEQVRRYEDLRAVAAAPIFDPGRMNPPPDNPRGEPVPEVIGVLTVFSTVPSDVIGKSDFRTRHEAEAASLVAAVRSQVPEEGALTRGDLSLAP
jgi:hypothetical protein